MTRRNIKLTMIAVSCLALPGCAAYAMSPVTGFLYSNVTAPVTATAAPTSSKVGEAVCSSILGIIAQGDCSITAAAKAGGITRIHHVDYRSSGVLGLFATLTVIVHGD